MPIAMRITKARARIDDDPGDMERVNRFFWEHADHLFMERRDDIIMYDRDGVVILIAEEINTREICAAAAGRTALGGQYVELCAARTLPSFGGLAPHTLHQIFICLRAVHADVTEGAQPFAAATYTESTSIQNLIVQGFVEWEDPPLELRTEVTRRSFGSPSPPDRRFFKLSADGLALNRALFDRWLKDPRPLRLTSGHGTPRAEIDLELDLAFTKIFPDDIGPPRTGGL